MSDLLKRFEKWMDAITFAEAGEWEIAREMMPPPKPAKTSRFEKVFMAVAFAEEGMHGEALRIMGEKERETFDMEDFFAAVGLQGVNVTIGVLDADVSR